jgi:hypothetical protein
VKLDLQAKIGDAAHASYRRCEHGRLLCVRSLINLLVVDDIALLWVLLISVLFHLPFFHLMCEQLNKVAEIVVEASIAQIQFF